MSKTNVATESTATRVRTTAPQRARLLNMLDPVAYPLPHRHGACQQALEAMGFLTYDMERGEDGRMKGWGFTPAGREKAEALRAVDLAEFA